MDIIERLKQTYKLWQEYLPHFPKTCRYTLGLKIDSLFVDTLELLFIANYLPKNQKLPYVLKDSNKLDLLKFFLQLSWEREALDDKKYTILSDRLNRIGGMIGNWIKALPK